MEGIIVNFRGSHKTQYDKQVVIQIESVNSRKDAEKLKGKKVVWKTPTGKEISGEITKAHGNNGCVLANFKEKGLPGQALGTKIKID